MIYLNCLAKDLKNAKDIAKASKNRALIGVLTANFKTTAAAVSTIKRWADQLDNKVSIGLGGGNPKQCYMVEEVASKVATMHINQVFTMSARTKAVAKDPKTLVNALVAPSGNPGTVLISTGPISSTMAKAEVPVQAAVAMIKESGVDGVKFFNMKDMKSDEEFTALAKEVAKQDMIFEPTGGLSVQNLEKYVSLAKKAGVKKLIPHLYTSIIDKQTGLTEIDKVKQVWAILDRYYK